MTQNTSSPIKQALPRFIFFSRWLQLPLYLGLIVAQVVYVYHFFVELAHLLQKTAIHDITETSIMLTVLGLIDVVMISNLLIMVIVGGYDIFVSRMNLKDHPDQPEWLDHVNAGVLKIKLAMAIISISSIHLLKTFMNVDQMTDRAVYSQVVIHVVFLLSALIMAWIDRISHSASTSTH